MIYIWSDATNLQMHVLVCLNIVFLIFCSFCSFVYSWIMLLPALYHVLGNNFRDVAWFVKKMFIVIYFSCLFPTYQKYK